MADMAHSTSVRQTMRSDSVAFIGIFAVLYVVFWRWPWLHSCSCCAGVPGSREQSKVGLCLVA